MTAARTCSAIFYARHLTRTQSLPGPLLLPAHLETPTPPSQSPGRSQRLRRSPAVQPAPPPSRPSAAGVNAFCRRAGPTAGRRRTHRCRRPQGTPPPPPITAEEHAKKEIEQLVKNYCSAYETLKPEIIQTLFPLINATVLRDRFKEYKSLKCTVTFPLEYDRLDARRGRRSDQISDEAGHPDEEQRGAAGR